MVKAKAISAMKKPSSKDGVSAPGKKQGSKKIDKGPKFIAKGKMVKQLSK